MRGIIKFFINNSVAANLLMVFIFMTGLFGLTQINTTFFPETPSRLIQIRLVYPGASPEEMEEGVVSKIEENLIGINGVKQTSSVSTENAATITVEATKGFDPDIVLQDVKNAVDQINSFPASLEPPIIFKQPTFTESYIFSISGDFDLKTLKGHARQIEDDLLTIDGISTITLQGFPEEEIEISFRESDMRALNITFDEAIAAISQNNLLSTGGTIKTANENLLIRAKNKQYFGNQFGDIVLRSNPDGGMIKLYQVANIKDQWADNPTRSYINGKPAVILTVFNTNEEDMFSNVDATIGYLKEFSLKNPQVEIKKIRDGKEYLNGRIEFIKKNGFLGFIIVLLFLAMFLNIRLAFWVALAIPISFAGMFLCASLLGITINVITTFGMVVVIGILVDDGIVIAENIFQHYEKGASPIDAAIDGTLEVLPAVSSAIITTVIAFATFFFLEGRLGDIFPSLSIVVIFTLIFSLLEGVFILPAHIAHSRALVEGNNNRVSKFFDRVMEYMRKRIYGPILKVAMKFPFPTIAFCIMGLIITIGAFSGGYIKTTFFPNVQQDNFGLNIEMPTGSNENLIYEVLAKVEKATATANEELKNEFFNGEKDVIEIVQKNIGPTSYQANMQFYLLKGEERENLHNRDIIERIRKHLGQIYEADKIVFGLGSAFGDPVSISLLGNNPVELENAVADFKVELEKITDLIDIQDSNRQGLKEVLIELTPMANNMGFTLASVLKYIRQGFFGAEIQRLQRGSDEIKVWARYAEEDRNSIQDLSNMRIRTNKNESLPLKTLANFKSERGMLAINHINGQREIRVTADVSNDKASLSDISNDIQTILLPKVLEKYPSVRVGIEGQAKESAEAASSMQKVMPLILLSMLFVVILTFGSVSQAFMVFFLFPFGFIGVGFGHWFMGSHISLLSMMGIIALIGIMVNDALVFIAAFNDKIREGVDFETALYTTGQTRFRPILLTTVTTVAGLMPLMLEKSVQAQFLIPMAISVAFGLIFSTFILLIMIPALLVITNRIRRLTTHLWTGEAVTATMVEPAYPGRKHPWILTLILAIVLLMIIGAAIQLISNLAHAII